MNSTPESLFEEIKNKKETENNTEDDIEFIMMTLMLPPSVIKELLNDGYIDDEDLSSMLEAYEKELKKEPPNYTGDDKEHPDYGNRFSDWDFDTDGEDYK